MSIRGQQSCDTHSPGNNRSKGKNYKHIQLFCDLPLSQFIFLFNFLKGKDNILIRASKMTVTDDPKMYWLRQKKAYLSLINSPGGCPWLVDTLLHAVVLGSSLPRPVVPPSSRTLLSHLYQAGGKRREH